MALEMTKGATHFGARFKVNGVREFFTLATEIKGQRPETLKSQSDKAFERARRQAQSEHDGLRHSAREKGSAEKVLTDLYTLRTGQKPPELSLTDLPAAYLDIRRSKKPGASYAGQMEALLTEFVAWMKKEVPQARTLADVTHDHALSYLAGVEARGLAERTFNSRLELLEYMFRKLRRRAGLLENPFADIPPKTETTVHKKPFTPEELHQILAAVRDDDFIRPIVVTLMCTALRRNRCCLLQWESVDFENGFITVDPGKGGDPTDIPIFPLLRSELEKAGPKLRGDVFPQQAIMARSNPDGITYRIAKALEKAGFTLNEDGDEDLAVSGKEIRMQHPTGQRMVNLRGAHSFRVTWVTLALLNGVPVEIVQAITGHKTVKVILKHYFRPNRQGLREALQAKMPLLLVGGVSGEIQPGSILHELRKKLEEMTADNWSDSRDRALGLLVQWHAATKAA